MKKNKHKENKLQKYTISTIIIIIIFLVMIFTFSQNIMLKIKRNKLNDYLEQYSKLKEEIDYLNEINNNYEIIVKNNKTLEEEKDKLSQKEIELNNEIANMKSKIDKLK